jgi:hypothetical protein
MRLSQPGAQNVDVRVSTQGGELRLAVRTGDADLAHGLREGLPELRGRLEDNGFKAETWGPAGAVAAPATASQPRDPAGDRGAGDARSQSGWSQQDSGRRNNNQQNQPRWVQDLEESLSGAGTSGDSHGLGH